MITVVMENSPNYKVLDSKEFISTSYRVLGKDRIIQINLK